MLSLGSWFGLLVLLDVVDGSVVSVSADVSVLAAVFSYQVWL